MQCNDDGGLGRAEAGNVRYMTDLKVVELYPSNRRDPVATLRAVADEIEAGGYGEVGCIAFVMLADEMHVFAAGEDSEAPSAGMLLHAGFMKLSSAIMEHGE